MKKNKSKPANRSQRSLGGEIVQRLERFVDVLEKSTTKGIADRFTCRTVKLQFGPSQYTPKLVKETRGLLSASQVIFAQFLGVSASAVRDWEQGLKSPGGAACRLMDEIRFKPDYFLRRLRELTSPIATE